MVPWELFPFQEHDLPALAGQHGCGGAAGRPAADYDYIDC